MKTRVYRAKGDLRRAQWRPPAVRKIEAGAAEAGPTFTVEGGSAS